MNRKLFGLILVLAFALVLSGCCSHEVWNDADCVTPKTCAECGETEGEPLGHVWYAATCETPKTCETCGATEGEALGHSWADATCEAPKTCTACGVTEGEALGHSWVDATTEAPKTCETCGATEGERIITDVRFTTAASSCVFGKWNVQVAVPGESAGEGFSAYMELIDCTMTLDFGNDGTLTMTILPADEAAFMAAMGEYTIDVMYQQFAQAGLSAQTANEAMKQTYGMTVEEYVDAALEEVNLTDLFSSLSVNMVYYVADGQLYSGFSWNGELEGAAFSIEGDTMILEEDLDDDGDGSATLTRVTE